jgi:hypothetical protein
MSSHQEQAIAARALLTAHEHRIRAIVTDLQAHYPRPHCDDFRSTIASDVRSKSVHPLLLESELLFHEVVDEMICTLAELSVVADVIDSAETWGEGPRPIDAGG